MTISHDLATRIDMAAAAIARFNSGVGSNQKIRFKDGSGNILASFTLGSTPWGTPNPSTGISAASLSSTSSSVTSPGGIGTQATAITGDVMDKDANVRMTFGVGTGSGDYNFDSTLWTHGGTVTITSIGYGVN